MAGVSYKYEARREMAKISAKISAVVTRASKEAWKEAVKNTPRDTGTAQAGWKLSVTRVGSYVPKRRVQKRPTVPNFRFRSTIDKRVFLFNNVEYISYLNDGKGPGRRVAHKMIQKARVRFESEITKGLK